MSFMPQTASDVYAVPGAMGGSGGVGQVVGQVTSAGTRFVPREATMLCIERACCERDTDSNISTSTVKQNQIRMTIEDNSDSATDSVS